MALRQIREMGDEILLKPCRDVKEITPHVKELIDDMFETLYDAEGVGLAAPQIGILKKIVIIDTGDDPHVLINPVILETSGEQEGSEGCLSVPGKYGIVKRPMYAKVMYYDENMERQELEGTGLLARAICHELDHLEGKLYVNLVEDGLHDVEEPKEEEEE